MTLEDFGGSKYITGRGGQSTQLHYLSKRISTFQGRHFHSWEYCSADGMQGKTVMVIAVDASRVAKQVYLSTRHGAWMVGRIGEGGMPADVVCSDRLAVLLHRLMPTWTTRAVEKQLNKHFDHHLYGLQPPHGFFTQIPVVNDDLPGRIISGRVMIKPNVKEFIGSSVIFEDGTVVDEVDVVVFATGYNYDFPFLPEDLRVKDGYRLSLYKHIFPPSLEKPSLAVVGFIHGLGAIIPLAEMQARWASRVFKGLTKLPSESIMLEDIQGTTKRMHQRFACSERNPLQVDYIPYLDDVAHEVGEKPQFFSLFLRDPGLGLRILFGPCTPYQYRLCGPGQWAGARQAIYTQWERVIRPFGTRKLPEIQPETKQRSPVYLTFASVSLLVTVMYMRNCLQLHK
ncbi:LOW QUALITY PROTEIN: flavin-containing monooxygenase 5-like [Alosa sapidissima]|uniref:LOW QUALITY PROTEIN: flavin-containing monooxygenase 5-like n=1 Tax=Alosa sapidissima TaxID=34773 RepID=UPI001C09961A|nr:LOW QUALITY PROTEIN: flavin-containing monooxygenase 5-like [Alosa sapidissima]